jgi:endonuclease-8
MAVDDAYSDLRGPTKCLLVDEGEKQEVEARLGPDPLRPQDTGEAAWQRISGSRTTIAALLMDQKVLCGVGNVYRAEVLFRQGVNPHRPGRSLDRAEWDAIWADLRPLMREGVRVGRIDTVRPEHTPEAMGRPPRQDDHGGEVYVYRRAGQPCLVCGTEVRAEEHAARNLFWCPRCQS